MAVLVVLLACTSQTVEPPPPLDTGPTDATAWEYVPEDVSVAMDPGVMQRELQELISGLRGYNATPVLNSWVGVRAYGDAACPAETVTESDANGTSTYFERLCIANGVTYFKGPLTVWDFTDNDLLAFEVDDIADHVMRDGALYTGRVMKGQTDVYEPSSDLDYNCSCTAASAASYGVDRDQWWTYTDGPTHWTGVEADRTWMDLGHQPNLYQHYTRRAGDGVWNVLIDGSVTGHAEEYGSVELTISIGGRLEDLTSCEASAAIEIVMRHTETGQSATLTFGMDPSQPCFGCADVVDGQSPVCIDFSAINDWEDAPW